VVSFDRNSKGAQAYLSLAQEMLNRRDGTTGTYTTEAAMGAEA
jgi:hypothetical protein